MYIHINDVLLQIDRKTALFSTLLLKTGSKQKKKHKLLGKTQMARTVLKLNIQQQKGPNNCCLISFNNLS